jgi:hypothetical protein
MDIIKSYKIVNEQTIPGDRLIRRIWIPRSALEGIGVDEYPVLEKMASFIKNTKKKKKKKINKNKKKNK